MGNTEWAMLNGNVKLNRHERESYILIFKMKKLTLKKDGGNKIDKRNI